MNKYRRASVGCANADSNFYWKKKCEEEKVHQFLIGHDETLYETVRSNILAQDPLLSLNKVYSILVQEECVRTISCGKEKHGEVMSFAMHVGLKSRGRDEGKDKNITCSNCNHIGHESDSCFELTGYPEWWGDRPQGMGKGLWTKGGQHYLNSGSKGCGGIKANAVASDFDKTGITGLSNEQWATLKTLLSTAQMGPNEKLTGKCSTTQ